jgi:hypothetical protein
MGWVGEQLEWFRSFDPQKLRAIAFNIRGHGNSIDRPLKMSRWPQPVNIVSVIAPGNLQ